MASFKRDYSRPQLPHYVERYIVSCDVCQAAKSRHVSTATKPRPLPVPDPKWQSIYVHWVSGLLLWFYLGTVLFPQNPKIGQTPAQDL